jgi:hypothetical protein
MGFILAVVFDSFFEWTLHRYIMHRPFGFYDYAFKAHALTHHRIFKADETYHLKQPEHKHAIPMDWWAGPVLVALTLVPFIIVSWFLHSWAISCGALIASSLYFAAYEYLHWCMHLPKTRLVGRSSIFFRLNGHHLLHHRYMRKNFNVILPLADLCLGTLLLRSKVSFAQATGPTVPNVQPKACQGS